MDVAETWFLAKKFNDRLAGFRRDPMSLVGRQDHPAHFINQLIPPVFLPISDLAYWFSIWTPGNSEHLINPSFCE